MVLKSVHNYMRGAVRCRVMGVHPERFFNKCVAAGIDFWEVAHISPNDMALSMTAKSYRKIRPIARASGCTLRLLKKRGALYSSRRFRKRYALLMGGILLLFFLWVMNSFVLTIEINGYERITPAQILAAMKDQGVGVGTRTDLISASRLRNHILLAIPELSWFTVTIRGSHIVVDVREREATPAIPTDHRPADIVAARDGVITLMQLSRGESLVKVGQTVQKGQVLVSGLVHLRQDEKTMPVHSTGEIYARVWHQETAALLLSGETKVPTGRKTVKFALVIGKYRINFYKEAGISYDKYDKMSERYDVELSDGSILPFAIVKDSYYEYESYSAALDEQEQAALLTPTVQDMVALQGAGSVVSKLGLSAWVTDRVLYVRATGESVQKIGVTVPWDE